MTWRFTDQTRRIVVREMPDGSMESKLASAADIQAIIGSVLEPELQIEPVPDRVTPLQMRRALTQAGLRAQVETYVYTLDQDAQDAWEYATEIRRDSSFIAAGAIALDLSSEQLDELFRTAAAL